MDSKILLLGLGLAAFFLLKGKKAEAAAPDRVIKKDTENLMYQVPEPQIYTEPVMGHPIGTILDDIKAGPWTSDVKKYITPDGKQSPQFTVDINAAIDAGDSRKISELYAIGNQISKVVEAAAIKNDPGAYAAGIMSAAAQVDPAAYAAAWQQYYQG